MGEVIFPTGTVVDGTELGGLSGITYDPDAGEYYVLSDDRSQLAPARSYTATIEWPTARSTTATWCSRRNHAVRR